MYLPVVKSKKGRCYVDGTTSKELLSEYYQNFDFFYWCSKKDWQDLRFCSQKQKQQKQKDRFRISYTTKVRIVSVSWVCGKGWEAELS